MAHNWLKARYTREYMKKNFLLNISNLNGMPKIFGINGTKGTLSTSELWLIENAGLS